MICFLLFRFHSRISFSRIKDLFRKNKWRSLESVSRTWACPSLIEPRDPLNSRLKRFALSTQDPTQMQSQMTTIKDTFISEIKPTRT